MDGSVEALLDVLDSFQSSLCTLDLIHYGVGPVTESDVKLAEPFDAIIYTFNTGVAQPNVRQLAKSQKVPIKDHNIIYRLFEDLRDEMNKLLPPTEVEEVLGEANVLQEFIVTEGKQKLPVAGCKILSRTPGFFSSYSRQILFENVRPLRQRRVEEVWTVSADTRRRDRLPGQNGFHEASQK